MKEEIDKTDYIFSNDLPSNYSRDLKKLYYTVMGTVYEKLDEKKAMEIREEVLLKIKKNKKK
jgi:hypothetical protein